MYSGRSLPEDSQMPTTRRAIVGLDSLSAALVSRCYTAAWADCRTSSGLTSVESYFADITQPAQIRRSASRVLSLHSCRASGRPSAVDDVNLAGGKCGFVRSQIDG